MGWGGGVNVLSSAYSTYYYAPEISGMLATLHVSTLQRSPMVSLPRYMLLRCRDLLWYPCHVTCCYAAEDLLWYPCYVTCCYAAEISGMLAHVTCCYAAEISYGGTMQLSKRVCCRSCLKRCGARDAEKN